MSPIAQTTRRLLGRDKLDTTVDPMTDTAVLPRIDAPPAKPTFDEIVDELRAYNFGDAQVQSVMGMMAAARNAITDLDAGESDYIVVDMTAHDLFDRIMPDLEPSAAGSTHENLERFFLPEGWGYLHDRHEYCSLQAVPKG